MSTALELTEAELRVLIECIVHSGLIDIDDSDSLVSLCAKAKAAWLETSAGGSVTRS